MSRKPDSVKKLAVCAQALRSEGVPRAFIETKQLVDQYPAVTRSSTIKRPRIGFAMATAVAALSAFAATVWWSLREPSVAPAKPATIEGVRPASPAMPAEPPPRPLSQLPGSDPLFADSSEAELDQMAATFAAEPALLDALEDATQHADPHVRRDAEQLLESIATPEPVIPDSES
jgi:hypothetical protein